MLQKNHPPQSTFGLVTEGSLVALKVLTVFDTEKYIDDLKEGKKKPVDLLDKFWHNRHENMTSGSVNDLARSNNLAILSPYPHQCHYHH